MKYTEALCSLSLCAFLFASPQVSPVSGTPASVLVEQFRTSRVFWEQLEIAKKIGKLHDTSVLEQLKRYLEDNDRHVRGNAAYVFAALGDDDGFEVIKAILTDRSERSEGQGIPGGNWDLSASNKTCIFPATHASSRYILRLRRIVHGGRPLASQVVGTYRTLPPCYQGEAQGRQTAFGRQGMSGRHSIRVA